MFEENEFSTSWMVLWHFLIGRPQKYLVLHKSSLYLIALVLDSYNKKHLYLLSLVFHVNISSSYDGLHQDFSSYFFF